MRAPHARSLRGKSSAKFAGPGDSGRLPRRALEEIGGQLHEIVSRVRTSKERLRAEPIRDELGLQARELPRVLKEGLSQELRCKGNKRATTDRATEATVPFERPEPRARVQPCRAVGLKNKHSASSSDRARSVHPRLHHGTFM